MLRPPLGREKKLSRAPAVQTRCRCSLRFATPRIAAIIGVSRAGVGLVECWVGRWQKAFGEAAAFTLTRQILACLKKSWVIFGRSDKPTERFNKLNRD